MAIIRVEEQRLSTIAVLRSQTLVPTITDSIFVDETGLQYRWDVGNSQADDSRFVITQTNQAANGRWVSENEPLIINTSTTTDALANKFDSSVQIIAVAGLVSTNRSVTVTLNNGSTIGQDFNFFGEAYGDGFIRIVFTNLSSSAMAAKNLIISVKSLYNA